jgi:hypothetical protein
LRKAEWLQTFRNGPPREIRTPDTQVRSLMLDASLGHKNKRFR